MNHRATEPQRRQEDTGKRLLAVPLNGHGCARAAPERSSRQELQERGEEDLTLRTLRPQRKSQEFLAFFASLASFA